MRVLRCHVFCWGRRDAKRNPCQSVVIRGQGGDKLFSYEELEELEGQGNFVTVDI